MSLVCWTTFSIPESLVNVGSEALCMSCNNILSFLDIKTGNFIYFRADIYPLTNVGVISGHNRYPFVAFAENIVNPSIYVLKYPELVKYASFTNNNVLSFIDIRFNDYDLLLALSGIPNYTISIWNFRTGQKILDHDTNIECSLYALNVSSLNKPQILQYSDYYKQMTLWEIWVTDTGAELYQVYNKQLPKEKVLPKNIFNFSYGDDNVLYYVDNEGNFFSIEIGYYYFKSRWSIPQEDADVNRKLNSYKLFYHKQGFLITCFSILYYIRKKGTSWQMEWKINVEAEIHRIVSTINGEVFGSTLHGKIWHLQGTAEHPEWKLIDDYNHPAITFSIIRNAKEECIIQLTQRCELRVLSLPDRCILSTRTIPYATTLITHSYSPFVTVGTSNGSLYFYNYDKPTEPVELAVLHSNGGYAWKFMVPADKVAIMLDARLNCYIYNTDFVNGIFNQMCFLDKFPDTHWLLYAHVNDDIMVFMYVAPRDDGIVCPHANLLWIYNCQPEENRAIRRTLSLPHNYRSVFKMPPSAVKNASEFAAARFSTTLIDILQYRFDTQEMRVTQTIRTNHACSISGLVASRNILSWSMDATYMHFRLHKKTPKMYAISQCLEVKYRAILVKKLRECCGTKYLIVLFDNGGIKALKISSNYTVYENSITRDEEAFAKIQRVSILQLKETDRVIIVEHTQEELKGRGALLKRIEEISKEVTSLIDYDIKIAGKSNDMFRKFCLNHVWLKRLTEEAEKLCLVERASLTASVEDQSRIRDWMYNMILKDTTSITYCLRTIYSDFVVNNYGMRKKGDFYERTYNLFLFYDMEPLEVNMEEENPESDQLKKVEDEGFEDMGPSKIRRKYFVIKGNAYEHILSNELAMQDINQVTAYQMFNQLAKYKILIVDILKAEFNKMFDEARKLKSDLIESILQINASLGKIYDNMNCMLNLLDLETFKPEILSVPEWENDEIIQRIVEVDDSEIKAINRRKKKVEEVVKKRGRWLLWSVEFWIRALQVMMDGVLEKLWEEEIKKDVPMPDFMLKKQPVEYTLEDQKLLREYEEKVRLLTEDRKKYLRILTENEVKAKAQKNNYIMQINQKVTELMITKLKYDYAVRHVNLRNKSTRVMHLTRLRLLKKINEMRNDIDNIGDLISRSIKFQEQFNKPIEDYRSKLEAASIKERTIDRQFKNQFLSMIPQQLTAEMNKAYKRRPKLPQKLMNNTMICNELSTRVLDKPSSRDTFPLPKDCYDYLNNLHAMEDFSNIPASLDTKLWEQFIKLRRQKIEMEFKIKALNLQLADSNALVNNSLRDVQALRQLKTNMGVKLEKHQIKYIDVVQDQTLEIRLTMGQVENSIISDLTNFENCVLMQEDDINDINQLILKAGQMKLKAMEKVAKFRRKVIYKEWEHKMVCANISYLKYILKAISKCKVSLEFLTIIRNWDKTKANKERMQNSVGLIEKVCADKVVGFRKNLQNIVNRLAEVREKIDEMKRENQRINRQIDEVKVSIALSNVSRDVLIEEKRDREQKDRMEKIMKHARLIETVRKDYVKILELKTLLELQRLRTYPTLDTNFNQCNY